MKVRHLPIFLFVLAAVSWACVARAQDTKRILILHSAHEEERSGEILRGIRSVLSPGKGYELHVERMDSAASGDAGQLTALEAIYRNKYLSFPLDLVIASGDDAFRFVLQRGQGIFGGAPLVFCGVREFDDALLAGRADVTGVLERVDYRATLEEALRLMPRAKAVHLLFERTPAGLAALDTFRREAARSFPSLDTPLLPDIGRNGGSAEVAKLLSGLPQEDFAFLLTVPTDAGDALETYDVETAMRLVAVPVFGCSETMVGRGLAGGKCAQGFRQGETAAGLGAAILGGTPPAGLPVVREVPGEFLFDYRELSRHGLEHSPLPGSAVLINAPEGFYRVTKPLAVGVVSAVILLVALSSALIVSVRLQRRTQNQLRESEAVYRSLVDNIELGITLIDKNHRIVMANPAHGRTLKRSTHEMAGRLCHEEFRDIPEPCAGCPGLETMSTGRPASFEVHTRREDDTSLIVHIRTFPVLDARGTPTGFIEVVEDITERKREEEENRRLETRVRESQKLQSLGILAGGVAHDFNNLLLGILGNADRALMKLTPDAPAREPVEKIIAITGRAADLSNQMLAYSGKGRFDISAVDVPALVREMARLLETVISKKARLVLSLPPDLPPVLGDATQMRQVVMNLITNASDALGPEGGEIRLSAGSLLLDRESARHLPFPDELPEGDYLYVEVADTGCGMDETTRARIFDPFFSTKKSGRGLGLAAVLGIVRSHRGSIHVRTDPGEGTTIRLLFPAGGAGAMVAAAAPAPVRSPLYPITVDRTALIAEDEKDVREVTAALLKEQGYEVISAEDGQEAVDRFREAADRIDFVLLDMTMPRLGGDEALRLIREIRPGVPAVLCSGYSTAEAVNRLGEAAANTVFLQKPYRMAALFQKIENLLLPGPGGEA